MDPLTAATTLATVVSLLADFVAHRGARESKTYDEFMAWLSEQRHDEVRVLLEQNAKTAIGAKAILGEITNQTEEIKNLTIQNLALSSAILRNTQQLTAQGSYPTFLVGGGQNNGNQTQLICMLHGEFAITNLTAKIVPIPDYENVSGLDFRILGVTEQAIALGTLRPHEGMSFLVDTPTRGTAVTIYLASDNTKWTANVRILRTDEGRKTLSYVQSQDGRYLWKNVDPGFPTQNDKFVIWSNTSMAIDVA